MGNVLIVSPRFPPTNAADVHRVRLSLPHYGRLGWEADVLCIDPVTADCPEDRLLEQSLPSDVPITRVPAWKEEKCRRFGFGQLAYRSLLPLYRAGSGLLARKRYDVVYFSTTVFLTFVLGPLWKWRYGCRIVYDFQDPWYCEQPVYTRQTVPGRWWKYNLDQWLARHLERFALKAADHVISVSDGYVESLSRRYRLALDKFTVLPFAGSQEDFDFARQHGIKQTVFRKDEGLVRWVYAGRAGSDMAPILNVLFQSIATLAKEDPIFAKRLRLCFVGTNYAPQGRTYKLVEPIADEQGVSHLVEEISGRIPYFETLSLYHAADAILLIGSVHADYTASKLITCVLSKKPILALFHRRSLVSRIASQFSNVFLATFEETPAEPGFRAQVARGMDWLRAPKFEASALDAQLRPYLAEESTRRQCSIFDSVLSLKTRSDTTVKERQQALS
jgi:hypothetical protein